MSFTPADPTTFSSATATVSINVDPAPLVVTVNPASKVYGAANPAFSVGYQGFVPDENSGVLGGDLTFSTTASAASDVGTYTISASGLTSSNYSISFVSGALSVTAAPLVVTPDDLSRIYGAANPTLTGTIAGLVNSDPITAVYSTSATPTSNPGTDPITAALNDPANRLGNYLVTIDSGALTITQAPLVVTPADPTRVYGAANPPLTGALTGVQNGDAITASFSTLADPTSAAGGYDIDASVAGANLQDYAVTVETGTLTVTAAPLVVTIANATKTYGRPQSGLQCRLPGLRPRPDDQRAGRQPDLRYDRQRRQRRGRLYHLGQRSDRKRIRHQLRERRVERHAGAAGGHARRPEPDLRCGQPELHRDDRRPGEQRPDHRHVYHFRHCRQQCRRRSDHRDAERSGEQAGQLRCDHRLRHSDDQPGTAAGAPRQLHARLRSLQPDVDRHARRHPERRRDHRQLHHAGHRLQPGRPVQHHRRALGCEAGRLHRHGRHGDTDGHAGNALLVVDVASASKTYGAANPILIGTITGLENNDPITATYTTSANAASDAGTYPIGATLNDPASKLGNYTVTINPAILTITPAPLAVSANSFTRGYGAANPTLTGTLAGIQNGDAISALFTTVATASSPAGPYIITAALSGAKLADYTVMASTGTLTVALAPLVVTVANASKVYGAATPALIGTITGLENNDPITATYTTSASATSDAGTDPIGATLDDPASALGNYAVTIHPAILTITPAPLSVTPDSFARLYGAANPLLTGTLTGVQNGDAITASFSTPASAASAAGRYSISAALGGAEMADYTVTAGTGTLTVNPAPLLVTPEDLSRVYGAANPVLTGTITGLENNDPITATYTTTASVTSDAGSVRSAATLNDPGSKLGNYMVTISPANLTITPAPLLASANSFARLYGAPNPALTGTLAGIQNGDAISVRFSTAATASSPAGSYSITAVLAGARLQDYSVTADTGTLTINPAAPLEVNVADALRAYGAANPILSGTVIGLENGDPISAAYSTSASPASDVGSYPISATLSDPDDRLGNYAVTIDPASLTVTPAPLEVTVVSATAVYGSAIPPLAVTYKGLVPGQDASVLGGALSYSTGATAGSGVGAYTVSASGLTSTDYAITYAGGTLTVAPAPLVVTPENQSRLYGAANPALTGTIMGLVNDDSIAAAYATSADALSDVGDYPITATMQGSALGNYTVTISPATLTVAPALLTVTPDSLVKNYGAANPLLTGTLSGVQNGDAITASFSTPAGTTSAVGIYAITAALTGARVQDYDVTAATATLTIEPAPLVVSVTGLSKVYGAANPTFGLSFQGFVPGDDASVLAGTPTFRDGRPRCRVRWALIPLRPAASPRQIMRSALPPQVSRSLRHH